MLQMCRVLKISRHAPPPPPRGWVGGREWVAGTYPWGVNMYTKLKISWRWFRPYMVSWLKYAWIKRYQGILGALGAGMGVADLRGLTMYTKLMISWSKFHSHSFMVEIWAYFVRSRQLQSMRAGHLPPPRVEGKSQEHKFHWRGESFQAVSLCKKIRKIGWKVLKTSSKIVKFHKFSNFENVLKIENEVRESWFFVTMWQSPRYILTLKIRAMGWTVSKTSTICSRTDGRTTDDDGRRRTPMERNS